MIILGIDPGSRRIGYGLIKVAGNSLSILEAGILKISSPDDAEALDEAHQGALALIRKYRPEILGIEKLYFAKNRKTAIGVAQARGVIIALAIRQGLEVLEYSPSEVKSGVAGYGLADKQAVAKMVRAIFGRPDLRVIDDASDALAVAYLASRDCEMRRRLS